MWRIDDDKKTPQKENLDSSIPIQDVTHVKITDGVEWIGIWDDSKNYPVCDGVPSYLTDYVCGKGHGECISNEICKFGSSIFYHAGINSNISADAKAGT